MNARKLPSGSWRARLFLGEDENGKKHYKSFTVATKREAERLALNYAEERATPDRITFKDALARYIESKSNVLSPSTLRGYRQMEKYYDSIKDMDVSEIDQNTVVGFINEFAGKTFAQDRSKRIQPTLCGHTPANTGCIISCYYAPKRNLTILYSKGRRTAIIAFLCQNSKL